MFGVVITICDFVGHGIGALIQRRGVSIPLRHGLRCAAVDADGQRGRAASAVLLGRVGPACFRSAIACAVVARLYSNVRRTGDGRLRQYLNNRRTEIKRTAGQVFQY